MNPLLLAVGVLTGTLLDPGGHPVRAARVEALHLESGAREVVSADDLGAFVFRRLAPGRYVLRIEWAGFRPLVTDPVEVGPDKTIPLSLTLELDRREEHVSVRYEAPPLQTDSAVVAQVITGSTAAALPLAGRSLAQLALLLPGVVTTAPASLAQPKLDSEGRPYVNGHREQGNSFVLDGVDCNEPLRNTQPYHPALEAVEEVRFETNNYSAAYGHVAGAVIQATLKSGANELRGSLFATSRPRALSANRWELNRIGAERPRQRQKNFGATLGGPLWPDRIFFFADYEGYTKDETKTEGVHVAPLKWRRGDFSDLLARSSRKLRDPTIPSLGHPPGSPFYVDPHFPGNVIPADRIDPVAAALLADPRLYPLPNDGVEAYTHEVVRPVDHRQGDLKLTAQPTMRDNVALRLSVQEHTASARSLQWPAFPAAQQHRSAFRSSAFNWNRTFGVGGVSQLQLGYNRLFDLVEGAPDSGVGDANVALGLEPEQARPGLSRFNMSGLTSVGDPVSSTANTERLYYASEHVSVLRGRHQVKVGGEWLYARIHSRRTGTGGLLGYYSFDGSHTDFAFADFLLGYVDNKRKYSDWVEWEQIQNRIGFFVEDVFRPSGRLTATVGLRWSYYSPWVEVDDKQINFDLATGDERRAGVDGNSRGLYEPYHRGFEPRLGLAWTPGKGWVLRAGYGIVQSMEGIPAHRRLTQNPPFFAELERTYDALERGRYGFDDALVKEATVAGNVNAYDPRLKPQWTQQWNVFIERALGGSLTLNVGYVGHNARRLLVPRDFNQPLPGPGPYSTATWHTLQQRRPYYPRWPEMTTMAVTTSSGRSRYDSLQAVVRQRPARGLELTASYTWGQAKTHNIQHSSAGVTERPRASAFFHARVLDAEYGPAWFDVTHNVALSGTYQLPGFLRGTTVTTIALWHSGFPITVVDSRRRSRQNTSGDERPDRVGWGGVHHPTPDRWLDISAWQAAPEGEFGSSGIGILRGPAYASWNLGVHRAVPLPGRARLILRLQACNVLNRANLGLPARDFASPQTFGKITKMIDAPRQLELGAKLEF